MLCYFDTTRPTSLFFSRSGAPRQLHSFPTRRSSDLTAMTPCVSAACFDDVQIGFVSHAAPYSGLRIRLERSEEHTSELQSRRDLVCRLLLEKKKRERLAWQAFCGCHEYTSLPQPLIL